MPGVRTLVVDDHDHFLRVAADVVRATPGFEYAGEAGSGAEALAILEAAAPDLAIVDVRMPDLDGIELTRRIKARSPATVVALISAQEPADLPPAASECGADEVACKQEFGPAMLRRMWAAHGGAGF
jgi:DNA-binding NarL/FixJ family response regulator